MGSFAPGTGRTSNVTFVTGLNILSIDKVPTVRFGKSFSSDGTYPFPIPIRNSNSNFPFELISVMYSLGSVSYTHLTLPTKRIV